MTGEPFNVPFGEVHTAIAEKTKKFLKRTISSLGIEGDDPPPKRPRLEPRTLSKTVGATLGIKTWVRPFHPILFQFHSDRPSLISIIRVRMFYARPNRIPGSGNIVVGLPLQRKRLYSKLPVASTIHWFYLKTSSISITGMVLVIRLRMCTSYISTDPRIKNKDWRPDMLCAIFSRDSMV